MFFRTPFFLPHLYPQLAWRIPTEEKTIYLTFDDGPVPGPTEFVLNTLHHFHIKATFFCIGDNVRKHPNVFQRIANEGHRIGNHTFHHVKGWNSSTENYVTNVNQCQEQFVVSCLDTNWQPAPDNRQLFRPPYGRITRSQIKALYDYKIIMWDVLTLDYDRNLSAENCLRGSIRATRAGSIVVFHDSLKAERNMSNVLPKYIEHYLNEGFTFDIISNTLT